MYRVFVLALLAGVVCGCASKKKVEPEKPLVVKIHTMQVPDPVMQSFNGAFPKSTINSVEKEVMPDGAVQYVFYFRSMLGAERDVRLSSAGNIVR